MKEKNKKNLCLILFLLSIDIFAYVHQRTPDGQKSMWPEGSQITLHVNGANSSEIASQEIVAITQDIVDRWNVSDGPNQSVVSSNVALEGRSDLYFSTNSQFFASSSVLAVTETVYNESNGKIIEADIIIKDSILFTSTPGSDPYVGDLISHEVGHLLGMDHATLPFSSMFYRLVRGQNTPTFDDTLGVSRLYNPTPSSGGTLSGIVAGSQEKVPVFAAEVNLISSIEGRVIASTLTEQDGSFSFKGLPLNDVYYVFIKPPKVLSSLTPFYQTARTGYCTGFASYKGSFFETCNNARRGFPQGIPLNSSQSDIDLGLVTIKCDLNTAIDYFTGRNQGNLTLANQDRNGDSITGFFTETDIQSNQEDIFTLDLSHIDASSGDLYLDLSLISQDFQSKVAYSMEVQSNLFTLNFDASIDGDFNPNLNLKGKILLDSTNSLNNIFTIRITPKSMEDFLLTSPFGSQSFYFPDFSTIGDSRFFYQFIFFIGKNNGSTYSVSSHYNYRDFRGNEACMQAEKTYGVSSAANVASVSTGRRTGANEQGALACGTIAFIDNDGGGPSGGNTALSLVLGLFFSLVIFRFNSQTS